MLNEKGRTWWHVFSSSDWAEIFMGDFSHMSKLIGLAKSRIRKKFQNKGYPDTNPSSSTFNRNLEWRPVRITSIKWTWCTWKPSIHICSYFYFVSVVCKCIKFTLSQEYNGLQYPLTFFFHKVSSRYNIVKLIRTTNFQLKTFFLTINVILHFLVGNPH